MSEITATLTKKIGPLPAWSYAIIGVGLGLLMLTRKKSAVPAAVGTGTLPVQAIGTGDGGGGGGGGVGAITPPTAIGNPPSAPDIPLLPQNAQIEINKLYATTDGQTGTRTYVQYLPNGTASWGISPEVVQQSIGAYNQVKGNTYLPFPSDFKTALQQQPAGPSHADVASSLSP